MTNSRTVFVLGAGASREETKRLPTPFPLALEFFEPRYLNRFPSLPTDTKYGAARFRGSALERTLDHYYDLSFTYRGKQCIRGGRVNIEDVASFFLALGEGQPAIGLPYFDAHVIYREVLEYIRALILSLSWGMTKVERADTFYHRLCEQLSDHDSIITFNWDCLVDRALEDNNKPHLESLFNILRPPVQEEMPRLAPENRGQVLHRSVGGHYLKLHGSINWIRCTNVDCYRAAYPIAGTLYDSENEYWERCDHCGALIEWCMMPPVQWKTYVDNRLFRAQFNLAHDTLRSADKIVIIGFSFSPYDVRSQHLFRSARLDEELWGGPKEIVIVNPAADDRWFREQLTSLLEGPMYKERGKVYKNQISWFKSVGDYDPRLAPRRSLKKALGLLWRD